MKHTKRLNLRALNLRSRRRFDRWFRLEVTGHYHLIGIASTWDRGSPVWPADYRLIYLASLNEESSPDGR